MEFRLYSLVNFYLSSIQQGIQTGHLSDNFTLEYCGFEKINDPEALIWREWIANHKTYIVLNGGDDDAIREAFDKLSGLCLKLNLPYSYFLEPGLGNIMTCCGAIIPEKYFNAKLVEILPGHKCYQSFVGEGTNVKQINFEEGTAEYQLIELIKSRPLAK